VTKSSRRSSLGRFIGILAGVILLVAGCRGGGDDAASKAGGQAAASSSTIAKAVDWASVDSAIGRSADVSPDGVHRYSFPRSDLKVTLDGIALQAGFALGSYVAFVDTGNGAAVMGDLVLTEPEVSPVIAKLQEEGLDVTAVHNHLLREQPKVMYVHYGGMNPDAAALARGVRAALQASATPVGAASAPAPPGDLGFDAAEIDHILGQKGKTTGTVLKYSVGRKETLTMGPSGPRLTPGLGAATVINFQALGGGRAAVTGDFALIGSEVAPLTRALRSHGIEVTAAHSHMTDDQPHLYYVHFFAAAPAGQLAQGLRGGLDATNSAGS
jgi:uncharacterized protein DUF1259